MVTSRSLLIAATVVGAAGCGADESAPSEAPAEVEPAVTAIVHRLPIRADRDREAEIVGRLRLGARLPRPGGEPEVTADCARGWHAVEPRGFVCLDEGAVDERDVARAAGLPAPAERPLPYRYARVRRGGAVRYDAAPTQASLLLAEQGARPKPPRDRRLGAGANDVPLDADRYPIGPAVVRPHAWGVGDDGYRARSGWFDLSPFDLGPGDRLRPVAPTILAELADRMIVGHATLRHRSGVAVAATTQVGDRRYAVTPDGGVVPVDRLEPALGTAWHGVDLREAELPLGFALRAGVRARRFDDGEPALDDAEYGQNEPIFLSGRYRTVNQRRYFHTSSGRWLRHEDLIIIHPRNGWPDFATEGQRWIDVSLANQTLVAYEGKKPVYATLISSGKVRLGDPDREPATPQGIFRVVEKAVTIEVDPQEVDQRYAVSEAPWALVTDEPRLAIVGNYWQPRFAWARGHHLVTVAPVDAYWLFRFAGSELPPGWHAAREPEGSTIVYVHK